MNHTVDYLRVNRPDFVGIENTDSQNGGFIEVSPLICNEIPDMKIIEEEEKRVLFSCIDRMKKTYSELIRLRYLEQLSYAEIAGQTNLSEGTVKIRLYRAKELLFKMMQNLDSR